MDPLLEADEGLVLGRLEVGRGQIFVAANGSFLLNATLVNREHRKLAGKLVDAIGPAGRDVVFLESRRLGVDQSAGPGGGLPFNPFDMQSDSGSSAPRQQASDDESLVRHDDPPPAVVPNGLELLLIWPTNWILLHFALVGILYCLWKLPIFRLPRPEEPSASADFGRHVDAVAALLQRTAHRRYASRREALSANRQEDRLTSLFNLQEFDQEMEGRAAGNGSRNAAVAIAQLRRNLQFDPFRPLRPTACLQSSP